MNTIDALLQEMSSAADELRQAFEYHDRHPEDASGSDDIDYRNDHLNDVVDKYRKWDSDGVFNA